MSEVNVTDTTISLRDSQESEHADTRQVHDVNGRDSKVDAAEAEVALTSRSTPLEVFTSRLGAGERFDRPTLMWLMGKGCDLEEIGAAAKLHGVDQPVLLDVANALPVPQKLPLVKAYLRTGVTASSGDTGRDSEDSEDSEKALDGWPLPIPLGFQAELPPFPLWSFPDWLRAFVTAVAEFTQTPPDLGAMVGLAVLSTVAAKRYSVKVRNWWSEPLNIYTVVALPSGERKSAVFRRLVHPLEELELQLRAKAAPVIREAETRKKAAEQVAKDAEKAAGKGVVVGISRDEPEPTPDSREESREELLRNAIEARAAADDIKVPPWPRLLADDITQEALASLLEEQDGRVAILSEEGGFVEILGGRYTEGRPNIDVFLKGHSGDAVRVDRKGRPAERINNPAITLGLTVQPDVVQGLARVKGFRGRGLIARLLCSMPQSRVGRREVEPEAIPDQMLKTYETNVLSIATKDNDWVDEPVVLSFDDDAYQRLMKFQKELEPQLSPTGALGHAADWGGKLTGAVVRIAGLLHIAAHADDAIPTRIRLDTVEAAIAIGEYLVPHTLAALDLMGLDQETDDAKRVLKWLQQQDIKKFSARDAFQVFKEGFKKMGRMNGALGVLRDHHYIAESPGVKKQQAGRPPSPNFLVNPWVRQA